MKESIQEYDVVALREDLPDAGLVRGQVGTVVMKYAPEAFEVEFVDEQGQTYGLLTLRAAQLMRLHHAPIGAAGG